MKIKNKYMYEAPVTKTCLIQVEDGICAGSADIVNPASTSGCIAPHNINNTFDHDFSVNVWDEDIN
ncbi:MAG: hypothetical protein HUJ94_06760 [Bacteroidales bacterium]|nr:hypothetical protein [Bacteroidales bacterium]